MRNDPGGWSYLPGAMIAIRQFRCDFATWFFRCDFLLCDVSDL